MRFLRNKTFEGDVPKTTKWLYTSSGMFRDACYQFVSMFLLTYVQFCALGGVEFEQYLAYQGMTLEQYKQILNIVNEDENTVESVPEEVKVEEKIEVTPEDVDMKFSPELASEFINTINKFTTVCAKIVKVKTVGKELSDDFYDLYAKNKNLADAASKTK